MPRIIKLFTIKVVQAHYIRRDYSTGISVGVWNSGGTAG